MKKYLGVVSLFLTVIMLALPTARAVNTDDRPFQNVHALTVLDATGWTVVGTGVSNMADAIDEWVPDGITSYAYTGDNNYIATLKLYDLQPADPYSASDKINNQSYTVSMRSLGSGTVEQMYIFLYICSFGIPGGNIINQAVTLSRVSWASTIINVVGDLTGYWDDLCIGFQGRLLIAGEQARVTWAEVRAPPAKVHGPSAFPLILGLSALLIAATTLPTFIPSSKRERRKG